MNEFDSSQHGPGQPMSITLRSQSSVPSFKNQGGLVDHCPAGSVPRCRVPAGRERGSAGPLRKGASAHLAGH